MAYWIKTPRWVKKSLSRQLVWSMPPEAEPTVYITFDDGPHPTITPFVLEQLELYNAQATFFCIGKNVVAYPDVYQQILQKGHATGNHTHNHLNAWKVDPLVYLNNIQEAAKHIESHAFRPPYGRIKLSQARKLHQANPPWNVYMWDVLSADFDQRISPAACAENVIKHVEPGSIVVFHDSEKAWPNMSYALPLVLAYCQQQQWKMKFLPKP